ncbi:MAG: hypothetical protein C4532_13180 [Candidatus Abyssobacteria bacterium SURF_17]|uniref:Uncharacterized protein n=1 Tax=Candidatus Abyssobacteria bacterium SURF_17 TaxID=2093361 RepID=A0A419EV64_9BACT|nr:MAG: hypothetical protein C4532_13180 [Candidatus Abyssubacteria bacterium SURF_17]
MKFLVTLFIIWVLWRVLRSVIDDLQRRMEEQQRENEKRTASGTSRRSVPQPAQRQTMRPAGGGPDAEKPGQGETDLERWYREALERKRRLAGTTRPRGEPAAVERTQVKRPSEIRVERPERIARVEPQVRRRREELPARPAVISPRERKAPEPEKERPYAHAATTRPKRFREAPKTGISQKPALADFLAGGTWQLDDVRRGIVFAEILGPPKAFGDIEAHVV